MKRLRLLMVTPRYWPLVGDGEQTTARLADAFCSRGMDVTLLTAKWHSDWPARVMHRQTHVERLPHAPRGGWTTLRYMRALSRWIRGRRADFDVIYVMNLKYDAYATLSAAASLRLPVVLRGRRAGPTGDCHWQATTRFGKRIRKRCQAASVVVSSTQMGLKELTDASYSSVVRIDDGTREAPERSAADRFRARATLADTNHDLAVAEYAPVAICIERLQTGRGVEDLIRAWVPIARRWPSAKLWIVGDGPLRSGLYEGIVDMGLHHHIVLPGSFDDWSELYQAADAYLSAAPGFSTTQALLDAMAAGLPVLTTDTPDMHDVLESGVQGYFFDAQDPNSLLDLVSQLSESPGLGAQLGLAARRRANEAFPLATTVDKHEELFRRVTREVSSG